jgi:hypothetical protein
MAPRRYLVRNGQTTHALCNSFGQAQPTPPQTRRGRLPYHRHRDRTTQRLWSNEYNDHYSFPREAEELGLSDFLPPQQVSSCLVCFFLPGIVLHLYLSTNRLWNDCHPSPSPRLDHVFHQSMLLAFAWREKLSATKYVFEPVSHDCICNDCRLSCTHNPTFCPPQERRQQHQ